MWGITYLTYLYDFLIFQNNAIRLIAEVDGKNTHRCFQKLLTLSQLAKFKTAKKTRKYINKQP